MFRQLQDFVSESVGSEVNENTSPQNMTARNTRLIYTMRHSSSSKLEATTFVKSQEIWNQRTAFSAEAGKTNYYDCKVQMSCPVKMYLILDSGSQNASLFETDVGHNHPEKVVGLSDAMKTEVSKLLVPWD